MKKILLISNRIMHYRIGVYNYFNLRLKEEGLDFFVFSNDIDNIHKEKLNFYYRKLRFNFFIYRKKILEIKPDVVIMFLHLKDLLVWPLLHWLKLKKIPVIYWNHGINLQDPSNWAKKIFFNYIHNLADVILLYSPNETKHISNKNRNKLFIANNTINFKGFPYIRENKIDLKKKYNIKKEKIVIFVGRIQPRKRLDDLLNCFKNIDKKVGLIIIGAGLLEEQKKKIKELKNVKYLGPIFDKRKISELFKIADVFCIPGANGLSINQAFYYGLPAIIENVPQGPETYYLKNNENGYIVPKGDICKLREKIELLLFTDSMYERFSKKAKEIIETEGSIEKMYEGFHQGINFCLKKYAKR
jgi:glycosyltransferase involved in cell wall biosynthesis